MRDDSGFTLIEALVAMAVLSVGAVTLLTAAERHSALSFGLAERVVARWAAENRLVAAQVGLPFQSPSEPMMGRDWPVEVEIEATADPDLRRLDVIAGPPGTRIRLTGFAAASALETAR